MMHAVALWSMVALVAIAGVAATLLMVAPQYAFLAVYAALGVGVLALTWVVGGTIERESGDRRRQSRG